MPKQPFLIGSFNELGHPVLKISVYGISKDRSAEFEAMIDTGFTGCLILPLPLAIPLGLPLVGTSKNVYANGETGDNLTTIGTIVFGNGIEISATILLTSADQALLGMGFLRVAKRGLLIAPNGYGLIDEGAGDQMIQAIELAAKVAGTVRDLFSNQQQSQKRGRSTP